MMGFIMFIFDAHASVMRLEDWFKVSMRLLGRKLGRTMLPSGSLGRIVEGEARISDRIQLYKKHSLNLGAEDATLDLFIKLIALIDIRRSSTLPIFRGYLFPLERLHDELRDRAPIKNCGHWPDSTRDEYVREIALGNWGGFNIKSSKFLTNCRHLPDPREILDRVIETAAMISSPAPSFYWDNRINLSAVKLAIRSRHLLRPPP
jgi:hypothetical protein